MCVGDVRPYRDSVYSGGILQGNSIALKMRTQFANQLNDKRDFTDVCELAILEYQKIMLDAELLQAKDE